MIVVADQKSQMNSLAVPAKLMNLCDGAYDQSPFPKATHDLSKYQA